MKKPILTAIILTAILGFFFLPHISIHAQVPPYQTLENLPGIGERVGFDADSFSKFLNNAFKIGLTVAIVLSIVMFVIGGIQYMGSDSFSNKEEAKSKFINSVWGLILALGIFLFLNTINPDLVNFKLKISRPELPPPAPSTSIAAPGQPASVLDRADDDAARAILREANVLVNKSFCEKVGDINCTRVGDLATDVISKISNLSKRCNCGPIRITGGTEWWLHGNRNTDLTLNNTDHRPRGRAVDFSKENGLFNRFIQDVDNSLRPMQTANGPLYQMTGVGKFLDENIPGNAPHWHAVFY